jgi:hypothetical protein
MSYKVGIQTKEDLDWVYNGLRFEHGGSAHDYGTALKARWPEVLAFTVRGTLEPTNCTIPVPSDRFPVRARSKLIVESRPRPLRSAMQASVVGKS